MNPLFYVPCMITNLELQFHLRTLRGIRPECRYHINAVKKQLLLLVSHDDYISVTGLYLGTSDFIIVHPMR